MATDVNEFYLKVEVVWSLKNPNYRRRGYFSYAKFVTFCAWKTACAFCKVCIQHGVHFHISVVQERLKHRRVIACYNRIQNGEFFTAVVELCCMHNVPVCCLGEKQAALQLIPN